MTDLTAASPENQQEAVFKFDLECKRLPSAVHFPFSGYKLKRLDLALSCDDASRMVDLGSVQI